MVTSPLVCVVDDAPDYRQLLQFLFNRRFPAYSAHFFVDGQHLLNELSQLPALPSLILLDRHMPVLDGHQTLLHLKAHSTYRKIPVILMSWEASTPKSTLVIRPMPIHFYPNQLTLLL